MTKTINYIVLTFFLASCKSKQLEKPIWVNNSSTVVIPIDSLQFKTPVKGWKAELLSFIQPIPLIISYNDTGFYILSKTSTGAIEGRAQICLSKGKNYFYYPISIYNKPMAAVSVKEYRSPKTVNPDSSLVQQKIKHRIDQWRNLSPDSLTHKFFFEEIIVLKPKAGTFRAQADKSLTSFYMQPGSCTNIPVVMEYEKTENVYNVTAGPMTDKYGNKIADGTKAVFIYNDGNTDYRMESSALNGFASSNIPAEKGHTMHLSVHINETISTTIKLSHQ
jgi:hypothetical protein